MEWNIRDDLPIYSQLVYQVKVAIVSGKLAAGDRLPSVRDLAVEAKVNPNTMQRALTELERECLVHSERTTGRFITEDTSKIEQVRESLAKEHAELYLKSMNGLGYTKNEAIEHLTDYKENEDGNT